MKAVFVSLISLIIFTSCNNSSKDSVEIADSTNKAIQDSAINNNKPAVDNTSSTFLVRIADFGMLEKELSAIAMKRSVNTQVKDFATVLNKKHLEINTDIAKLAKQKMVVLPENISSEKQKDIELLTKTENKDFDKTFVNIVISKHQNSIELFEKAMNEAEDYDVKTFAEKTLPILKSHLETALSFQKKL